ncbi:MAG: transporter substrate-binding domain-containing protein [Synergistaceae bacterium]|nr:transporter substrate-binding domain-containing protein [Synergistaceae bacterium]
MKKFLLILFVMFAAFFFLRKPYKDLPVLRVGIECDYVPNNWEEIIESEYSVPIVNHQGFYADGNDVQIAKFVAEKIGMRLEVHKIAWDDLISALLKNEIDAIFSAMLDTEESKKRIAFSDTYDVNKTEYVIVVQKGSKYEDAEKLADLSGALILGQKNTNQDKVIDQIPGVIHAEPVNTASDILSSLVYAKADGVIVGYGTGSSYTKLNRNLKMIRFLEGEGFVLGFSGICAGLRKRDRELLSRINDALRELSSRERQSILDRATARSWRKELR